MLLRCCERKSCKFCTSFTCFTTTKVQILTQKLQVLRAQELVQRAQELEMARERARCVCGGGVMCGCVQRGCFREMFSSFFAAAASHPASMLMASLSHTHTNTHMHKHAHAA